MRVDVLYFAAARERAGVAEETLDVPAGSTVATLRIRLVEGRPALAGVLPRCRLAIADEFAAETDPIPEGAVVAVIPPVAGGAPRVSLGETLPSIEDVLASVRGPDAGAVVLFVGAVRASSQGRDVVRLDYEAFGPMAEKKLAAIADECAARFGARVAVAHRTGTLAVGDTAVVIAAAAAHRAEAFDACRHAIERLKQDVPIWKKEHFADGTEWVGLGP